MERRERRLEGFRRTLVIERRERRLEGYRRKTSYGERREKARRL